MSEQPTIQLTVPGNLRFRDVAIRAVAAACRLVGQDRPDRTSAVTRTAGGTGVGLDLKEQFDRELVSAFSEIFNNIAIHGYANNGGGSICIELEPATDHLIVDIQDNGLTFDPDQVPAPELDALPEGGMGIHIARACVDELDYTPGPPNRWRLTKYLKSGNGETE